MNSPVLCESTCALGALKKSLRIRLFPLFHFTVVILLANLLLPRISAQVAPPLGTARNFAVLGSSTVTNTGATHLMGDLGVSPGTAITGFPPGTLSGTIHSADAVAAQGQADALVAYNSLAGEACTTNLSGTNLGGLTLSPGVYCFNAAAQLTGTLTLDATGNSNAVFIFKIGSTLTTAVNSSVVVRGGSACNVYYQVGSSATLGTGTQLLGSVFAKASITETTGAAVTGGAYALTGAVTLDTSTGTACKGTINVCKVAGNGVTLGAPFTFSVGGTPVTVAAGAAPGGTCSQPLSVPAQQVMITETLPAGTNLTSVSTLPGPGLLVSSNLAAGTATVTVQPGGQTTATFVDTIPPIIPTTGFLQVCKVAGPGVNTGTSFTFNVAGTPVTVNAGAAPGGACSAAMVLPAGQALITETLPVGTTVTDVHTSPSAGLLVSSNLAAGSATVTIVAGGQTMATFTDSFIPTTGLLQICKVAGNGISVGANFTFNVAGNPVVVPAGLAPTGSCSQPIIVPPGPTLITETLPQGVALTSVSTLPAAGLLLTSNLAAGTATVTVNAGGQTTATFVDTLIPIPTTGFVQVCKVAGAGVVPGTNFSFNVAGTPITVPAGPAPNGTCAPPQVVQGGPVTISENVPAGTALTSVSTLPNGLLVNSNLAAGTATVTVNVGGQTIVTFLDTLIPIVPTTGFLQVCKVAGAGVPVGTNFTFNIAGTPVVVQAGPAPGGTCSPAMVVPAGQATVTETVPSGTVLSSVSTVPAGSLVSSNLATGSAVVSVAAGGQTIATFLDTQIPIIPTTGTIQVCKIAGAGVVVGMPFMFNVGGTPVVVPAGPAPAGSCSSPLTVPAGAIVIDESIPAGTTLTSVSTLPAGLLISENLAAGAATVTVNAGGQTIATFLNTIIPVVPTTGLIQICKVAGAGISPGAPFTFNVGGTPVTVPAGPAPGGTCSPALTVPAGVTVVTESVPAGIALTSVSTSPAGLLVSSNLAAGIATVTVNAGGETIATFLDTMIPVIPTTGFIQVCKVAGSGVPVGTNFSFNVAGTSVIVPAGPAPGGNCSTPMVVQAGLTLIAETLPPGDTLTSVDAFPAGSLVSSNLAAGTVSVMVTAGGQTIATFLDSMIPVIPITGFIQVCKIAGAGVSVGTNYTFNVAGTPVVVQAGPAPGGNCSAPISVLAGPTIITETVPSGIALTAVSTMPSGLLVSSNLSTGTATVTVNAGGQTIATFLDTMIPIIPTTGFLQVCKIAGAGVAAGTNFTFNVAGTQVIVPAGPAPAGSCSTPIVLPAGPALITEMLPAGVTLTSVNTLPAASLINSNLATGAVTVTVTAGGQTIATFLDSMIPVIPTTGFLQVCKVAGANIPVGTNFTFNIGGTPVIVPAGPAPGGTCSPAMVVPAGPAVISETLPPGVTLTSVSTLPAGSLVSSNLASGTVTVTVAAGGQTIATFLDTIIPIIPSTGLIQICKVGGGGITPGTNFTFNVGGVQVIVPAGPAPNGSCSPPMTVPSGPLMVGEILPTGITLTSVSTVPPSLLISSNLNSGMATVTITPGGQTTVTFLDAMIPVIPTTGFLQICKIAGAGVPLGSAFVFDVAGTPVTVPAGPAPGGSCSPAIELPPGQKLITENLPAGTTLTSVSTLPASLLVGTNLAAGSAMVTVNAGGQTIVTFLNTVIPVIPNTGLLQICKVAGGGISPGTNFTFMVGGNPITVPAGPAPGGSCSQPITVPAGATLVTESIPSGIALTSVITLPSGALLSSNLPTGLATVMVNQGGQTIVTFLDTMIPIIPTTGFLQICKIAGAGVVPGTPYTFNAGGTPVIVPAGPAPGGSCSSPMIVPAGPVIVTEMVPGGTALTSVSTLPPGSLISSNLATGGAVVTVPAGGQTIATFLNTIMPVISTTGLLQICKVAGSGVDVGTNFTFNAAGTQVVVPAGPSPGGTCSQPMVVPAGAALITETLPAGVTLSSVTTLPAGLLLTANMASGTANVTVNAGGQTVVTFVNSSAGSGLLKICEVAGPGVTPGTPVSFTVGTHTLSVPAGFCSIVGMFPVGTQLTAVQTIPSGNQITAITVMPPDRVVGAPNLVTGQVTFTIGSGVTEVGFTNSTATQATGQLQVCKIAGLGLSPGGNFTFSVGGANLTVPSGSCVMGPILPVGSPVTIAELPSAGTNLAAITVLPANRLGAVNLAANSVTATIGTGVTQVNFTNTGSELGVLKICKIAGAGVMSGQSFPFTTAGAAFTVPAGFCVNRGTMPVGSVVTITEGSSTSTILASISALPPDRQGLVDLPGRAITITVGSGITEVYFTNVAAH